VRRSYAHYQDWAKVIQEHEGGFDKFSKGYERFGFQVQPNNDIVYTEWAPGVTSACLVGDFSPRPAPLESSG
jgi:1,4-alpha-glucan branching enzyme